MFGGSANKSFGAGGFGGGGFGGTNSGFGAPAGGGFSAGPATGGFGGGGFGAPAAAAPTPFSQPSGAGFGNTGFGAASGGAFGAQPTAGGFGATAASTPFGAQPNTQTSAFGSTPFSTTTAQPTGFGGASANPFGGAASTGFGATNTGFGAPASSTGFGAPATGFGAPAANTGFGSSAPNTGFGGGGTSSGAFGASGAFGSTAASPFAQKPAFGASSTSFGSTGGATGFGNNAPNSGFGGATGQSAFGVQPQSQPFGSPTTSAFGTTNTSGFGATNTAGFGASATGFGAKTGFGSPTNTASSGLFGSTAAPAFGAGAAAPSTGFGSAPFGSAQSNTGFGSMSGASSSFGAASTGQGTRKCPFKPIVIKDKAKDGNYNLNLQVITGMAEYSSKSIEELHFEDYLIMKGGGNTGFGAAPAQNGMTAPTSAFGAPAGFGNTQQTTTGFGGFGATTTSNTGFGAPSTGFGGASGFGAQPSTTGFGAQPTTGFGAQPSTGFGAQPSTGFGAQPSTGFGAQPSSGFGAQPSTTGFGSQTSGFGGFGSTPSTTSSAFGAPASGGFGGSATAAPSSNGFSFGSSATTAPTSSFGSFGASTGSFGATSTTPSFGMGGATTGFGSSTSALSSFGNQTTQNTTLGGFGSSPGLGGAKPTTGGFGTLGSSTGFGAPASAPSSFSFSATPGQPASTAGGFGSLGGGFSGFGTSATSPAAKPTASLGSGFGTSSFNSGFGNFAGATSFGFTPQNTTNLAQGQTVPALPQQPTTPTMDQRIELLVKKKEEIIGSKKPEESESSKQSPSILFAGINSDKSHAITRSSPSSHANILPRGLRSTTSLSKSSASSNTMNALLSPPASKSQLLSSIGSPSPQPSIAGSAKKLVISMGSPLPNSREELPLPPSALSATTQTPLRSNEIEARSTGFSISSAQSHKYSAGEATGLTPSKQHGTPIATPYSSSIRSRGDFDRGSSHSKKKLDLSYSAVDTPSIPVVENDVDRGSMVPVLEKEGYLTSPDISILQKMAPHELARVKNFAVLRPNIGKIEWEGVIDVRGMNIGDIVRIEPKEVFVYENMIEPAEGQGLNRPATITFFGIYPKDRNNKEKVEAYEKKLRSFCEQNDAEFINYDIVSGEWNFAVKHFSRYGLDDSDEEDSTQQSVDQHQGQMEVVGNTTYAFSPTKLSVKESVDTVQQLKSIMMKEQPMDVVSSQTPKKEGLIRSDVESASKTGKAATSNLVTMPWLVVEKVEGTNESPLKTANVVTTVRKSEFALPEQSLDLIALKHKKLEVLQTLGINAKNADAKLYVDSFTKHHTYIVQSVDARKRIGFNVNSTEKLTAGTRKQNAEYFKLAMGRSFRVGWSADGRIVHAGRPGLSKIDQSFGKSQRVIIEQSNTSQWQQYKFGDRQEDNEVAVEQIFQTMLASSRLLHNAVSSELTSQWKVAQGLSFNDEYLHFLSLLKNWQQILRANLPSPQHPRRSLYNVIALIDALYGQEKADWNTSTVQLEDLIPLGEDRESVPEHWERRRLAISKWLEDFTSDEVPVEKLITTEQEMYERAFQLLSIHRVEDAVSVLEDGNAFRLALLLSQIGSDTNNTYLLRSQMELWKSMGAFAQFPAEVSRIYQLLASNVDEPSLILKGLGWKRGLAMLFWYFTENPAIGTFSEALHLYDEALLGNAVDAPMSTYATEALKSRGANVAYPKVKHGIYSLLEVLLSDKSTELNNVLHPAAFTRDELDYQTVYFTSVLLESVGHLSAEQSELAIIRQHIIFQLLSMKKWKWAVFVALQNPNATTRTLQVRDILGRFAAKDGNWESSADHVDIVKLFKVDPKLLFEAHAYKVGSHFNFSKQVQYLHDAELWHEALKVVILKVAPALLSQKPDEYYMTLLQLMEFNEANSSRERVVSVWTEIGSAVLTYLRLYDATKDIQNNPEVQIADVLEEFSNTAKDLLLRIAKIHASKVDVQSNDTLFQQLLQSIASYAYKLLTFIDLKTRNHYPSQTVLFHDYVLQHAPVQMQFFEEAANTSNLAMMKFSADCLSF